MALFVEQMYKKLSGFKDSVPKEVGGLIFRISLAIFSSFL